jgi:hypothetical protein
MKSACMVLIFLFAVGFNSYIALATGCGTGISCFVRAGAYAQADWSRTLTCTVGAYQHPAVAWAEWQPYAGYVFPVTVRRFHITGSGGYQTGK